MPDWSQLAVLLVRIGLGVLYLNAAWSCVKDKAARDWTTAETGLVFKSSPRLFAMAGIAMMALGGASVLLGVFARVGGLILAVFTAGGTIIHLTQRSRAVQLQARIFASVPEQVRAGFDTETLQQLSTSAALGHFSSALKNLALITVALFLTLHGAGHWSIVDIDHWFR